jgi:hypothetical protein
MAMSFCIMRCKGFRRSCSSRLVATIILTLASFFSLSATSGAAQLQIGWDPSTNTGTGYKVYYGNQSRNYTSVIDAGANLSSAITGLSESQVYYFAVTTYNAGAESAFSPELVCYFLTAATAANGQITPAGPSPLQAGGSQTFSIAPNSGYSISDVQVDGASVGPVSQYTFANVTANHTISATFALNTYTITSTTGANGSISPAAAVTVNWGASQTFAITAATGYHVADVQVDGSSVGAAVGYTFSNVTANHTISATFAANTYTITPTAGANGSITPSTAAMVNYGASQTFAITAATGYHTANVQVDGSSVGALTSYTFSSVAANHTISATFAANTYTITPTAGANGSISPSTAAMVNYGASQTFTITAATGYHTANVQVDGSSVGAAVGYTFSSVTANHTISATFAANTYTITPSAGANGSITPAAAVTVNSGASQTFTITAAARYRLSNVLIDGASFATLSRVGQLSAGGLTQTQATYTFTNVNANHSIMAVFSKIPPPIADAGPDQTLQAGSTVTLDGNNSTDATVGIASYKWTQVSGPSVTLAAPTEPICTFTAPAGASGSKLLVFNLLVTDTGGVTASNSCFVNVSAGDEAPLANAGPGQTVSPYAIVNLNASGSSDPDGKIASYKWVQISGPAVRMVNANTGNSTFIAPPAGVSGVSMVFQLQVTDNFGLSTRDQCTVNVMGTVQPPVAHAAATPAGSTVTLDGSGSLDPGGSALTYRWKQLRGAPVTLSDPTAETPVFTVPSDVDADNTNLVFMLTVTDTNSGLSATSKCAVNLE